jgi:hypothetical protein
MQRQLSRLRNSRNVEVKTTGQPSPTNSFKSGHVIEVRIVAEKLQSVLPYQSGNPEVVLRYRLASHAQLMTNVSVNMTGF